VRRAAAHVPQEIAFATKPHLARAMVERAIAAGVPFAWVVGDSVYGVSEVEMALRRAGKGDVLGVAATSQFNSWGTKPPVAGTAAAIAGALDPAAWRRLSAGAGAKGARLFDWAYLELADLEAAEYNQTLSGLWTRGLLIRRNLADGELAFFATWCHAGTPVAVLVSVEGRRWAIEDSFETAKNELGLDHNETRSWHGWHRHVSLVMLAFAIWPLPSGLCHLAFAMMTAIRRQANTPAPPKSSLRMIRRSRR
jgi:SRSO17 transposase